MILNKICWYKLNLGNLIKDENETIQGMAWCSLCIQCFVAFKFNDRNNLGIGSIFMVSWCIEENDNY